MYAVSASSFVTIVSKLYCDISLPLILAPAFAVNNYSMLYRLHTAFQRLAASTSAWFHRRKLSQHYVRHKVPQTARMLQTKAGLSYDVSCLSFCAGSQRKLSSVKVSRPYPSLLDQRHTSAVVSTGWLLTSAKTPIEFQRAKLGMSILLSPSGLLLSFEFSPQNILGLGPS
jgi:hypothetical protein